MDVQQIGNDFGVARMGQCSACNARRAVVHARHRVEQMREAIRPAFERGHTVFVRSKRVADLHAKPRRAQRRNDLKVSGKLGCERDQDDGCERMQLESLGK